MKEFVLSLGLVIADYITLCYFENRDVRMHIQVVQ